MSVRKTSPIRSHHFSSDNLARSPLFLTRSLLETSVSAAESCVPEFTKQSSQQMRPHESRNKSGGCRASTSIFWIETLCDSRNLVQFRSHKERFQHTVPYRSNRLLSIMHRKSQHKAVGWMLSHSVDAIASTAHGTFQLNPSPISPQLFIPRDHDSLRRDIAQFQSEIPVLRQCLCDLPRPSRALPTNARMHSLLSIAVLERSSAASELTSLCLGAIAQRERISAVGTFLESAVSSARSLRPCSRSLGDRVRSDADRAQFGVAPLFLGDVNH
jgi:hypothetical protein